MRRNADLITDEVDGKKKSTQSKKDVLQWLRKTPDDPLLLARLSYAYFEEGNFEGAFEASSKAYRHAPQNPLVMWGHARALYGIRRPVEGLYILRKILRMSPRKISKVMEWRESKVVDFQNTCRFEVALCYIQLDRLSLAIRWMESHLAHRRSGLRSYYLIDAVRSKLNCTKVLKRKIDNNERRLWISLVEVEVIGKKIRTKHRKGFTNGLVVARSSDEAIELLKDGLLGMGYRLIGAEDTEEFLRRDLKSSISSVVRDLASEAVEEQVPKFTDVYWYRVGSRMCSDTKSAL